MALPKLASLPVSFTKMLLALERESSSLAKWNSNVDPLRTQCRASHKVGINDSKAILRRSANYQPSIWTYAYIQSLSSEYKEEMHAEQVRVLREEVRMMLCKVESELDQLELIDVLQRLGVAYHFNNEIRNILDNIYNTETCKMKKNLYATALEFRLLRQHGYNITPDVFHIFLDEAGDFKKCQSVGVEGMLSLYEASFHSLEDETILDEARDFTSKFLKEYVNKNEDDDISLLINHALELPLHWRVPRWEAQWFINVYGRSHNMSSAILQFAKLDFNIVQAIHQEELKHISRWWKRIGFVEKLTFSRDRLVENFLWTVGANSNPDFGCFRRVSAKINSFVTTIDDMYDVYGTLEELESFTDAIVRWDQNYAMDNLPDYMKICFLALSDFVSEIASETLKANGIDVTPYLKKAWADICKSYFIEAKWYYSGYTPSLGEYMENAWISISEPLVLIHAYFLIPNSFTKEDLVCLEEYPSIFRFSGMLLRLANDLGSAKREIQIGDAPNSIQCYMNETGASEMDARDHVKSIMSATWKKMNGEVPDSTFSRSFKDIAANFVRMALYFYRFEDGYTDQDPETKSRILSVILQPIL